MHPTVGANDGSSGLAAVFRADRDGDAAANLKGTGDLAPHGVECLNQIVENLIGQMLMENTLVTEGPIVEFQRLGFHNAWPWNVTNRQRGKIGLTCSRAKTGELRGGKLDHIRAPLVAIGKGL